MNNSDIQQESESTQTLDYFKQLNDNNFYSMTNIQVLDRTIFSLLLKYSDVFVYNEQQQYNNQKKGINYILENGLLLGKGSYGNVYSTINPNNNQRAALKVQEKCDFEQVIQQAQEFKIQKKIANKFPECIIQIQNQIVISQKYKNTYRMYAYLDHGLGNLKEYLIKLKKFSDLQFDNLFNCILDSILKIHSLKIAHGDIKLENIINTQKNGWVLADFGCAIQYQTPYGNYPIVGTRVYLQKPQRTAFQNDLRRTKINLFKKDIFAFQLAMLQILYPDDNIFDLQQILDQQQKVHPKIDWLYNKDYININQKFLSKKFIRCTLIQEPIETDDMIKMKLQNDFNLSFFYKNYQDQNSLPFNPDMNFWNQQFFNLVLYDFFNEEDKLKKMMIMDSFIDKYSKSVSGEEIFEEISIEDLSKFEYDLYFDVLEKKGQKLLQLMLCQGYQAIQQEIDCNIKLQEAELLYTIGEMDQAKLIINSIQNELELENDELLLKFICLKSRLNNQWLSARDEIIPYFINYRNAFQMLNEWKFIFMDSIWLNKQKSILNAIYNKHHNMFQDDPLSLGLAVFDKIHEKQYPTTFFNISPIKIFHIDEKNINVIDYINIHGSFIKLLQKQNYDKYFIFYHCWIFSEMIPFNNEIFQIIIKEFIQFIEENLQNYYFNWVIFDLYGQFLTYKGDQLLAQHYLQKAYYIIQNDCLYNQLIVLNHIFQQQFHNNDLECIYSFTKIIKLLNQMPNSKITQYLFVTQLYEINQMISQNVSYNQNMFFKQIYQILKAQTNHYNVFQLLCFNIEKMQAIQNDDFFLLKSAIWEYLPQIYEATGNIFEQEVLICFQKLIIILEVMDICIPDETRYTSQFIQSLIIFIQLGCDTGKFPLQILDQAPYIYARSCHRSCDERKSEEAIELFSFQEQHKIWFY
ncbi:unnamed protein product [Paramecium sonneborni]|uniref:Protein kinase domain-containing protein n=1 Tax=Paramecium sonneborni TaxID=65129 RepID=A0A8S1R6Q6_9CILI|nr:unnamed protein product [Paramecium sonneborni]